MGKRLGRRGRLAAALLLVLPALAAPAAFADAIPGATYTGSGADGSTLGFTVSPDGTLVDSYWISNARGDTCRFYAGGQKGLWQGAPITGEAFEYRLFDSILFRGSFPGPQSAAGTFRLHNAATGATAACDTGVVNWTATTTAVPPPGGSQSGGGGGANTQSNGVGQPGARASFATRVVLRKLSVKRLGGRVISSKRACRSGRTLILWRGPHRIGSTRAQPGGRYSFPRTARLRGRRVRVSVLARSVPAGMCAAGSSIVIRA